MLYYILVALKVAMMLSCCVFMPLFSKFGFDEDVHPVVSFFYAALVVAGKVYAMVILIGYIRNSVDTATGILYMSFEVTNLLLLILDVVLHIHISISNRNISIFDHGRLYVGVIRTWFGEVPHVVTAVIMLIVTMADGAIIMLHMLA